MIDNYKIIVLCGSTKFRTEFERVQKKLTLSGNIVLSLGAFSQSGGYEIDNETKAMLADMHRRKINMADEIYVVNPNGYIGDATKEEIAYAEKCNKKIRYLE